MSVHDLYSKRNKKTADVFTYDELPEKLRIQIVYIWKNFFVQIPEDSREKLWKHIHSELSEELGKKTLLPNDLRNFYDSYRVEFYFENKATVDECLNIIEFVFGFMNSEVEATIRRDYYSSKPFYSAEQAIKDLNTRFLENGVGYLLEQWRIIRMDSKLLHQEVITPTFNFLNSITFKNASEEFLSAHEHFRFKRNKECLTECAKTFETTMKIICSENNWNYDEKKDTASKLIDICLKNDLIPDYLQTQFSSLRAVLESGIPTLRNKLGAHGQGAKQIKVPDHFVSYMLYLTGTTVYFLISCQKEIKPFN